MARSARARAGAKAAKKERAAWSLAKGNQPARDPDYLAFVRMLPCLFCWSRPYWIVALTRDRPWAPFRNGRQGYTEACHIGPHAFGRKASDYTAVPACRMHHERAGSRIAAVEGAGFEIEWVWAKLAAAYESGESGSGSMQVLQEQQQYAGDAGLTKT